MLINSLLAHASDSRWEEFIGELEKLNVRKAVVVRDFSFFLEYLTDPSHQQLMSLHTIEDLTSCILDFQANMIRVTYRKKTSIVDPEADQNHAAALVSIWSRSHLEAEVDSNGHVSKWRRLGFDTEDIVQAFSEVGVLGLECLVSRQNPVG